jgi:hypothetical protein
MNKITSFAFLVLAGIFVVSGNVRTARTSSGKDGGKRRKTHLEREF